MAGKKEAKSPKGIRMAELSKQTGVSIATIKYYIREGLVPPGQTTSANQAWYSHQHVERIRLIQGLSKVAKMSMSSIAQMIEIVDGNLNPLEAMKRTQHTLVGDVGGIDDDGRISGEVTDILHSALIAQGWEIRRESPAYVLAVKALAAMKAENLPSAADQISRYVAAADEIGATDIASLAGVGSPTELVRGVAMVTSLRRPLIDALVLLAQQHHAITGYSSGRTAPHNPNA